MKNLSLVALFVLAVLGFGTALQAHANTQPNTEAGLSRPVSLDPLASFSRGRDGGEEDEEDFRISARAAGMTGFEALQDVDPSAIADVLRLRAALEAR